MTEIKTSNIWKKIRMRYCILKALISGPKSEQELLSQIPLFPEFCSRINKRVVGELSLWVTIIIKELKDEAKIKRRDIFNTLTEERRIEWFLNPEWLSRTRLFKVEIKRIRELEETVLKAKIEQDRIQREKEEIEKLEQIKKINQEREAKSNHAQLNTIKANELRDKSNDSNSNSFFNAILSIVAFGGGLYIITKIGDSLSRAITFPVFLIACAVAFSIYHLTKNKEK